MILVAIGSNLPHPVHGAPIMVCEAAVKAIAISECRILSVSQWFSSAPVPVSDQPDFVNGVVSVETDLSPARLLGKLHRIEADFGRQRGVPNAARTLDLDLIAFGDLVMNDEKAPILPHPRLSGRASCYFPCWTSRRTGSIRFPVCRYPNLPQRCRQVRIAILFNPADDRQAI